MRPGTRASLRLFWALCAGSVLLFDERRFRLDWAANEAVGTLSAAPVAANARGAHLLLLPALFTAAEAAGESAADLAGKDGIPPSNAAHEGEANSAAGEGKQQGDFSPEDSNDDFESVTVEDDPFGEDNYDALRDLAAQLNPDKKSAGTPTDVQEPNAAAAEGPPGRDDTDSIDEVETEEETYTNLPLKDEAGNILPQSQKNSLLESVKKQTQGHMMAAPNRKIVKLAIKGTLEDKLLKEEKEKEQRRQKRRMKLALERHQRKQQEKFDPRVELSEKEAKNKKINKVLQKLVAFFENRF
ncbi:RNA recognition motif-containing protein [Besnoitia besnoiti]|uniref:RNA recognition motif-containing protein n=1 Tax=Besnoitia besnoiti TaxID=94643 RepID=A0A2A9M6Y8_BESBE|nr:RNA recognition motif-containing protein [Besnoitia besnoiti]PFH33719.1 RNA recognition motif-containing protein [Besnoitia besnoiti]